jgi:hypothetical protein
MVQGEQDLTRAGGSRERRIERGWSTNTMRHFVSTLRSLQNVNTCETAFAVLGLGQVSRREMSESGHVRRSDLER